MARRTTIKDRDKGYNRVVRSVGGGGAAVLLGIQGKEAKATHRPQKSKGEEAEETSTAEPMTVGEIAAIHEFGLGVPERSWLRGWFDENRAMIENDLRRAVNQVILGKLSKRQAAEILGLKFQASIQERIVRGIPPANAPSTIARKGSSTPLIDTGQLRSAITYKVEGALSTQAGAL